MWPFKNKEISPEVSRQVLQNSTEDMEYLRLNDVSSSVESAIKKNLDPSNLAQYEDNYGHFQSEFDLTSSARTMKGLYLKEPWVYTTASLIARTLSTIPFQVINRETGEIDEEHPLNKILRAGNDLQDCTNLNWSGDLDLVLGGNEFLVYDEGKIVHVPLESVELKFSKDMKNGAIDGITVNDFNGNSGSRSMFIEWEKVIHFKMPNPFSPFTGMSMITAALRPIVLDRHKNEFELAFYLRGGTNSGVIEMTEEINKTRIDRLMQTYENAFTGRRNWFRQLFLPKGAKWINSSLTMNEMQHLDGLRENRLTLLAVLGIPPSKVGIVQDVNRSTSEVQDKTFYENTIVPIAKMKAAGWNNSDLVRRVFKGEVYVEANFDGVEAVEGGILSRAEKAKALDNIATVNEQREIAKLPPLKASDPRGNMFAVQLTSMALNPFSTGLSEETTDLGPEEEGQNETITVNIAETDGHTHRAQIDELGNGVTISTDGTDDHVHSILSGEVQPSGDSDHVHPSVDASEEIEDRKTFQRLKKIATGVQESIEISQGRQFLDAYRRNYFIKFEQVREGLAKGIKDMRTWLNQGIDVRISQYQKDGVKVLQDTVTRGFTYAQSQTRSMTNVSKKSLNFSAADEMAIEILKERTEDDKRRTLVERNIESYLGFDSTSTEQIQKLIDVGLEKGKTLAQIAKTIEQDHGENYRDQAFTIARTETLTAISGGMKWQNDVLNGVFSEVGKQWFHVGDVGSNPQAREGHASFEDVGQKGIVPSTYVWKNPDTGAQLEYPRDPNGGASDTINCRCSMVSIIPKTATSNADQIIGRG